LKDLEETCEDIKEELTLAKKENSNLQEQLGEFEREIRGMMEEREKDRKD